MFKGFGGLALEGDHLDLSWRDLKAWPSLTPHGSLRSFAFDVGDPTAGPSIALGLVTTQEVEPLDWKHSIDPVHHHGTDQFRIVVGGDWILAGKLLPTGSFGFQEAGWIYQEHPGSDSPAWTLLVLGDRRGARATLKLKRDAGTILDAGEMNEAFGVPVGDAGAYPHPAGDKGLAAVATTLGPCDRGYLNRRSSDLGTAGAPAVVSGLIGDEAAGPLVHVLKAGPLAAVLPPCVYATELVLVVIAGSCRIGATRLEAGDLRVTRADAPLEAISSEADGLELALIVADRRARPIPTTVEATPAWTRDADRLLKALSPRPGGVEGHRAAAARA